MAFGAGGAFSTGNFGNGGAYQGSVSVQSGSELTEIQSSELEFSGFSGETKVQLLPTPWPESQLPPPTSSLLSVASRQGLLAAAGPDSVIVAKLDAVREAFKQKDGNGNIKPFQPQLVLPIGIRVSQVAFSCDGSCLAISAEQGGGIAAYETQSLLQGNTNSAFELASEGQSLRALVPNPAVESAELFAAVTTKGQLLIADMKARALRPGKNGVVLQEGVSSVAWSSRGKALLAGLGNGSLVQLKPDGTVMSEIPRPSSLEGDKFVSAISWLENYLALFVYTPSSSDGMADPSDYYIWERTDPKVTPIVHTFSKLPEVASGWGDRTPAAQFLSRLRDFHNCDHIILVAATPSEDVGVISRSKVALAEEAPVDIFTATSQVNDSRRAQLPMKADMSAGTTPIGMALDLASTTNVIRPIPGDEYDESPGPLPGLMILNNDGVLAAWWIVYADAIRKGVRYPGMIANGSSQPAASAVPAASVQATPAAQPAASQFTLSSQPSQSTPAFGQTSMGAPKPAFGQTSFGSAGPAAPAFGQPSKPTFGQSSFASPSLVGANKPAFGSPSTFGASAAAGTAGTSAPLFGASSSTKTSAFGGNSSSLSPFATAGAANNAANEAKTANATPFATGTSAFGKPSTPTSSFAQATSSGTISGNNSSAFGSASPLGAGAKSPFAALASNQIKTPSNPFGSGGALMSGNASTNVFGSPSNTSASTSANPFGALSNTTTTTTTTSSFGAPSTTTTAKPTGNPFGALSASTAAQSSTNLFGKPSGTTGAGSSGSLFGSPSKLGLTSSFAEQAKNSNEKEAEPEKPSGSGLFSSSFGDALDAASKATPAKDHEESASDEKQHLKAPQSPEITQSTTPKDTPAAFKISGAPNTGGLFNMSGTSLALQTPTTEKKPTPTFSFTQDTPRAAPREVSTIKNPVKAPGETPLPPESTSKDSFTPTNSSAASSIDRLQGPPEAAPLPPDFTLSQAKPAASEDAPPLPPDFTKSKPATTAEADAPPLPPDFTKPLAPQSKGDDTEPTPTQPAKSQPKAASDAPLPPDFLSKPKVAPKTEEPPPLPKEATSPLDDEGSGVDVANELSSDPSPESSFGSKSSVANVFAKPGKKVAKPVGSVFDSVSRPSVPFFNMPPPSKEPESPRSPSPVRQGRGTGELQPPAMSMRSVSGPAIPKASQGMRKVTAGRMAPPPQKFVQPIMSIVSDSPTAEEERAAAEKKRQAQQAAEEQELSDQEDEYIRAELEAPIKPTTKLASFLAHTDYTGGVAKTGVPGQIEVVFRDANSMIDTLGLNARSITAWMAGHSKAGRKASKKSRTIDDLESPEDWTLVEVDDVLKVEDKIEDELHDGTISDRQSQILGKVVHEMTLDLNKLRRRNDEIARTVDTLRKSREEEEEVGDSDLAPLSAAAQESQHDLRRALTDFRSNLASAEESVALLRAKLSSTASSNGDANASSKVPTVEAVERTISKMTTMIERKSADLDVLIAQARQLGILEEKQRPGSKAGLLSMSQQGRHSRSGSPFESPTNSRPGSTYGTPLRNSLGAGGAGSGSQFTPSKSRLRSSIILNEQLGSLTLDGTASARGDGSEPILSEESAKKYAARVKVRKQIRSVMKEALGEGAPRIRTLDDD